MTSALMTPGSGCLSKGDPETGTSRLAVAHRGVTVWTHCLKFRFLSFSGLCVNTAAYRQCIRTPETESRQCGSAGHVEIAAVILQDPVAALELDVTRSNEYSRAAQVGKRVGGPEHVA